jgi:hypothetical protein
VIISRASLFINRRGERAMTRTPDGKPFIIPGSGTFTRDWQDNYYYLYGVGPTTWKQIGDVGEVVQLMSAALRKKEEPRTVIFFNWFLALLR